MACTTPLSKKFLIVGAGIAGLALARQFKKFNIPYVLIEKRKQLTTDGAGIALPANAMHALKHIGLHQKAQQMAHPVYKIIFANKFNEILSEGSLLEPPLNMDSFVALHRQHLQQILLNDDEAIYYNTTLESVEFTENEVKVRFANTTGSSDSSDNSKTSGTREVPGITDTNSISIKPQLKTESFAGIIGADGVHSMVRNLCFPECKPYDLKLSAFRWICDYPTKDLQPTYLLGQQNVFMAYPISSQKVYCYAHVLDEENTIYSNTSDARKVLIEKFKEFEGIAKEFLNRLPENSQIICGRLTSLPNPVFSKGRIALLGDAAHACSPVLQQGAALAFEDAVILSELIKNFSIKEDFKNIEEIFKKYDQIRKQRVGLIMQVSDAPLKMLPLLTPEKAQERDKGIKENGPLNIQGWKKLFATNPLEELGISLKEKEESCALKM